MTETDAPPIDATRDQAGGRRPRVVVVGAGFGGLAAVRALERMPVDVLLVDRRNFHLFQPLLYQVGFGMLDPSAIAYPVRSILRHIGNAEFLLAEVTSIDLESRTLHTSARAVGYDHLVLAAGSANSYFGLDGVRSRAFALKELSEGLGLRNHVLAVFEHAAACEDHATRRRLLSFGIIGGGPTGVECAGALSELVKLELGLYHRRLTLDDVTITLLEASERLLGTFAPRLSGAALRELRALGVHVVLDAPVREADATGILLRDGTRIPAATILWTAGVAASSVGRMLGVDLGGQGRVPVGETLQVAGHPEVLVIGDMAERREDGTPLPMLAPVAMQQGGHAARVIDAALRGEPAPPFRYRDKGTMATVGRSHAVVQIKRFHSAGFIGWLIWLFVHLIQIVGFRNRILVLVNWAWDYVFQDRPVRIITGPTTPPDVHD